MEIKRKVRFLAEKQIQTLRRKRNRLTKTNTDRSSGCIRGSLLCHKKAKKMKKKKNKKWQ